MKRSSLLLGLFAGLLLIATGYLLLGPSHSLPALPLRGIPKSAHGFVRVRMARVLASRPWREIVVERGEARGIERVKQACGFNPLEGLEEVFVSALPRGSEHDVVISARGSLAHTKLIDCVVTYSGGSMSSFVHERIAGFDTVRSKKGTKIAAFVGRDGIVAGDREGVRATLQTLAGATESAERDAQLKELYAALSEDSDIALAVRLPSDAKQRAALLDKLPLVVDFPLDALRALSANVQLVEDRLRGDARFWTRSPEDASALARRLRELRGRILTLPGLGLMGFAAPVRALRIENSGSDVVVQGEIKASTLNAAIDLLPAIAALQRGLAASSSATENADAGVAGDGGVQGP